MSTSSSRNQSRRTSRSGPSSSNKETTHKSSSERRSKAKSAQIVSDSGRRRASQQADTGLVVAAERPALKSRVNSAPLAQRQRIAEGSDDEDPRSGLRGEEGGDATVAEERPVVDAQDEDEVAGVVGAVKHFQPFKTPEVCYFSLWECTRHPTNTYRA